MLIVAVVSVRWIPRGAKAGTASLPLWIAAGFAFFLPLALVVRDLSARFPEQGGLYVWTEQAFGAKHGFFCGWCLWLNQIFYFPSYLLFAFANFVLLSTHGQELVGRRLSGLLFVLAALWALTALNVAGFSAAKWLQNLGTIGIWMPIAALFVFAAAFVWGGKSTFVSSGLSTGGLTAGLGLWSSMCFAFSGVEIAAFSSAEIRDARRTIPRAIVTAAIAITLVYVGGSLAVLLVLDPQTLNDVTGMADAIGNLAGSAGMRAATAGLLGLAALATTSSWIAGAARIACIAGQDGAFPRGLGRVHERFRTPHVALVVQALAATGALLVSLFLRVEGGSTSLSEAYDVLVNLAILLYFVPYLYLFAVALKRLARRKLAAGAGLATTAVAIVLLFVPPPGTNSAWTFELNLVLQAGSILIAGVGVYWLIGHRERNAREDRRRKATG
jgi:glutamate:GABA antiporter